MNTEECQTNPSLRTLSSTASILILIIGFGIWYIARETQTPSSSNAFHLANVATHIFLGWHTPFLIFSIIAYQKGYSNQDSVTMDEAIKLFKATAEIMLTAACLTLLLVSVGKLTS